jgi:cell division protein FtsB
MKEKNKEDITSVFALTALSVILAILTIFSFVMMQRAINERIATEKAYYQIQEDNKDLKKQIDLLQSAIVEKNVDYFEDYNFYLLVVVSRERTNTDFVWTYGLQVLDDNSDTVYVDSDKLFSIGEHIVAIELKDNSVILIDLS